MSNKPKHSQKPHHGNKPPAATSSKSKPVATPIAPELAEAAVASPKVDHSSNDYYFNSYAHFGKIYITFSSVDNNRNSRRNVER
jgi:hypothetical protein